MNTVEEYSVFEGEWREDKPNGKGRESHMGAASSEGTGFTYYCEGNLKDGLWDGYVEVKLMDSEYDEEHDYEWHWVFGEGEKMGITGFDS